MTEELETILVEPSVEGDVEFPLLPSSVMCDGGQQGTCGFKLVGIAGAVESLAAEVLELSSCLYVPCSMMVTLVELQEEVGVLVVGIGLVAVATMM